MGKSRRLQPVAAALLLAFFLTSCIGTSRTPSFGKRHKPVVGGPPPVLKVATREELIDAIARNYDAIESFAATKVSLTASTGSFYAGHITEYNTAIPAVILFRKPDDVHIQASKPYVGTLAFDMVSDETSFRFYYPEGNEFIEGLNAAPATSQIKMENLRPKAFLSSMLIRPWDNATESVMLKDETDEEDALYRLEFNLKDVGGKAIPGREVWFDRLDLTIVRQKVYDDLGNIVSDTSYSDWKPFNGISFPAHIDINRPKDGYRVALEILQLDMNKELTNAQFNLPRPEGTILKEIK